MSTDDGRLPLILRTIVHISMWITAGVVAVMLDTPEIMVAPVGGSAIIEGLLEYIFKD